MRIAHHHSISMQSLPDGLGPHAEVRSDLLAAPALGVELSHLPHLLLRECWGCGVDTPSTEMSTDGDAVDVVVLG